MDGYLEIIVSQKMNFEIQVKRAICTILPIMVAVYLYMIGQSFMPIVIIVDAILFYVAYRMFMNFYIEWEYTFVTNEISFAKIMNKSKRKDLLTCQIKDTIIMVKNTDKEHLSSLPKEAKKYAFLSGEKDEYYIWATKDKKGRTVCISFEPTEELVESMCRQARSKIYK